MSVTIQVRRDSAANWTSTNPVLHQGEIGLETDTGKSKMGDGATAWASLSYWQPSGTLNYRGQVQYGTTYNPGDVILYNGERINITSAVTTGAGTNGLGQPFISGSKYVALSSLGIFYASDYGVSADGSTDNWAALQNLLILVRSLTTNSFGGYRVILPAGTIALSKTLILPTSTMIEGQGLYSTTLKLLSGANCDVVQTEQFNSSAQAALLTTLQSSLTAGNLRNAFRWGIRNLTIHGNSGQQAPGGYYMGLNAQTNPLLAGGTGDPDFDPAGWLENVQFRSCIGDGFFYNGRSALRMIGCIAWFCNGNGFSPSFDTQLDHCQAGFNGIAGFYLNHGADQGAGNKSYNNGSAAQWVSGSNYSAGQRVMYSGLPYDAINALTGDTVAPPSDTANWAAVTATSPAAWGCGVYMDANAAEITFNCDCQENSASSWYFRNCTGTGIHASGVSFEPNFNQATSALNSTNPNNYAHVAVDGSNGIQAAIACGDGSGHTATQYRLRVVNGSTRNDITLTGDVNATFLTPDSITLVGSGNSVRHNGVNYTSTLASQNDVSIATPGNGQVLAYSTATNRWQNSSAGSTSFAAGAFGDGSDGAVTLDGTVTVPWASKSGSTYTLSRNCFCTTLTVNSGVTLVTGQGGVVFQVFATTSVTNNGTIQCPGGAGSATGGGGGAIGLGSNGAAGGTGAGSAGTNNVGNNPGAGNSGAGGAGSTGAGGGAAAAFSASPSPLRVPQLALAGTYLQKYLAAGCGGGGGGGDGTNKGGGGGAGGGLVEIFSPSVTNSGSGTVSSVGGNGGTPTTVVTNGGCGGGGGGGGGLILVYTLSAWTNTGTTSVTGGTGGTALTNGSGTAANGSNGGSGSVLNVVLQ